ncbi:hypothetical protein B0H13DRAFT_1910487 [Mycena leptocephala]|nr:hypothetical protein B0H13DRAFT_1910487 [Mycena leptocephala]
MREQWGPWSYIPCKESIRGTGLLHILEDCSAPSTDTSVLVQTRVTARDVLENEKHAPAPSEHSGPRPGTTLSTVFDQLGSRSRTDCHLADNPASTSGRHTNAARLVNKAPLSTTAPLAPVEAPRHFTSVPQPSWLDQQMSVDIPGAQMQPEVPSAWFHHSNNFVTQPLFNSNGEPLLMLSSSVSYSEPEIFSQDPLDQYLAT